jgi:hypothetical protein
LTSENAGTRLGDLLTAAGVLKLEQLQEAVRIARQQSLPVGRVLIMYGYLSGLQLQAALHLQSMLKDNLIDHSVALRVLGLIASNNISVSEALQQIGWEANEGTKTNKLGELLLASGIIDDAALNLGLKHSEVAGIPLGRVLVNLGAVSEQLLSSVLTAQMLVREGKISREKAVQGLMAAKERQIPIEQSLQEVAQIQLPLRPGVRLGQLLSLAGLLEERDLMQALELGLIQEQPIGRMLLSLNLVSEENLLKALEAQALVAEGMDIDQAASILTTAITKSCTISHACSLLLGSQNVSKLGAENPSLPMYQLLQLAGILGSQELELAVRVGTQDTEIMSTMLQKANVLDKHVIAAAAACADLIQKRVLKPEQAIMVINHCKLTRASVYEFFDEFGWSRPAGAVDIIELGKAASKAARSTLSLPGMAQSASDPLPILAEMHESVANKQSVNSMPMAPIAALPNLEKDLDPSLSDVGTQAADQESFSIDEKSEPSKPEKGRKKLRDLIP